MRRKILLFAIVAVSFLAGAGVVKYLPHFITRTTEYVRHWDNKGASDWPVGFTRVAILSSIDGQKQPAYFIASQEFKPLLVSLHTWGGDYSQSDPLADLAKRAGWNYIHPNAGGPNRTPLSCLSSSALLDIDDALSFAIANGHVDIANIFVAGVSGGGYMTIGAFMRTKHKVKEFSAWAPITDLNAWYGQSKYRRNGYAENILACTSSQDNILNEHEAILRSPLYWEPPALPPGRLTIYAGIDDGYSGSVPISHSILLFNKLARHYGHGDSVLTEDEMVRMLTRSPALSGQMKTIGGRAVLLEKATPYFRLIVFEGSHEMLSDYLFGRLQSLANQQ